MSLPVITLPAQPESVSEVLDPAAAHERVHALIAAVPDEQLVPITSDVPSVSSRVLGVYPKLVSLLPQAASQVPSLTQEQLDEVRDLALALAYTHAVSMTGASLTGEDLAALYKTGQLLRDRLVGDARYLVGRGVIEGRRLGQIHNLKGYSNLAYDLLALVSLFRDAWAQASTKSAVTEDDLEKAGTVARRLLQALTTRAQTAGEAAGSTRMRQRAYSLLFRRYDAIRRAVAFLRWEEDDADDFAPSLMAIRRGARRDRTPSKPPPSAPGQEGQGVPVVGAGKSATVAHEEASKQVAHEPAVPVGHEGGSPFIR